MLSLDNTCKIFNSLWKFFCGRLIVFPVEVFFLSLSLHHYQSLAIWIELTNLPRNQLSEIILTIKYVVDRCRLCSPIDINIEH